MEALTVAPSEFGALLDAISGVGDRVDGLRHDVFSAFKEIEARLRALETYRAAEESKSRADGERRHAVTLTRRWLIALLGGWAIGFCALILDLLRILQGTH